MLKKLMVFDINGTVKVDAATNPAGTVQVTVEAETIMTSGCENCAIVDFFGIENLVNAAEEDAVLKCIDVASIVDHVLNHHNESVIRSMRDELTKYLEE